MPDHPTIKDVAREAGVSYQTVSKVLNHTASVRPETERRIRQAVARLGYSPNQAARSLRSARNRLIGYSGPPWPPNQANPILDEFLQSMLHAAEIAGYYLLCFPHHDGERQVEPYRQLIEARQVDGFIVSGVEYDDPRLRYLLKEEFPFVAFGRSNLDMMFSFVDVNGKAGMFQVVKHLHGQGRRRIAALAWPENSRVGQDRMAGYREALQEVGIEFIAERVARGEGTQEFGYQATRDWLALAVETRPDAVVAFNDAMAVGAIQAIRQAGLHTGVDISVTGFDDLPMARVLTPPLTSVRLPVGIIGRRAIEILVLILQGRVTGLVHELVEPELVVRQSSTGLAG
jgi:DNA-binding LacI/PurR family transcriptional regulator